jgi:hypothetical protein
MFFPGSRFANAGTYTVRAANGAEVIVTRIPVRPPPPVRGFHLRLDAERPDLLAAHFMGDATTFWRLCDAAGAVAPDALAARDRLAIPETGR